MSIIPRTQRRSIANPTDYIAAPEAPMTDDPIERKKYRTEIPNIVDDSDLSVYAFRLYVHIKRVAGANGGACHQGARTMSKICKMSPGQIAKAKKELLDGGWITRTTEYTNGGKLDVLTPVDLWEQNYATYARSEPVPQTPEGDHTTIKGDHNTITNGKGDHTTIKGDHTVIERKNHEKEHEEKRTRAKRAARTPHRDLIFEALAEAWAINWDVCTEEQRYQLNQSAGILRRAGQKKDQTEEQIAEAIRYVAGYIRKNVWPFNGSNGATPRPPAPAEVRSYWGQAMEARAAKSNGSTQHYYTPVDENRLSAEETAAQVRAALNGGVK